MIRLLTLSILAALGVLALPQTADGGTKTTSITYKSGYSACGCPLYTKRILAGYDQYKRPIYRYVAVPNNSCRCKTLTCNTRPILRTSSCDPWSIHNHSTIVRRTNCGTRWSTHRRSSTIIRIRTCR